MNIIRTVRGDIPPEELGITYCHEHMIQVLPAPFDKEDPDMCLLDENKALEGLLSFEWSGGEGLVDMTTLDMGRNPEILLRLSKAAGVHIVAATGMHKDMFSRGYIGKKGWAVLSEEMISDVRVGMQDTSIRAGVIKMASSKDEITEVEQRVLRAAATAHLETGAPISTHTDAGTCALEQIEALISVGVAADRILIGHLDRKLDADYHMAIAQSGVFMGFDQIGKTQYAHDAERIELIQKLIAAGHEGQILLSGDLARRSYLPSYGPGFGPGLTHILSHFVPEMLGMGINIDDVNMMLIENPMRFLGFESR
jgi:5-phospho-D-xylono-1,4-lactonase